MNNLQIFHSVTEFIQFRRSLPQTARVGFVPTMGALHEGHASLLKKSVSENDITVLSIFVNPTQFNDKTDFEKYPKTWETDLNIARECGVRAILSPDYRDLYPDDYRYKVSENEFSKKLCGQERTGHFDGVLTVVMKLLNIVNAQKNYFGEKDYQQLQLIRDMTKAFFMPLEIVSCPTLREPTGLAMSSRNARLSANGREKAALIYKAITGHKNPEDAGQFLTQQGFRVEYVHDEGSRRFIAAHLEGVRLIDNVELN